MYYKIKNIRKVDIVDTIHEPDPSNMIGYVVKVQDEQLKLGYPTELSYIQDGHGNACDGYIKIPTVFGISHKGSRIEGLMSANYVYDLEWYQQKTQ